jgi:hypothetical protein
MNSFGKDHEVEYINKDHLCEPNGTFKNKYKFSEIKLLKITNTSSGEKLFDLATYKPTPP